MRSLLLAAVVLTQAPSPASTPTVGAAALEGTWTGTTTISAVGECKLAGGFMTRKPVEVRLWRKPDGSFAGRLAPEPPGPKDMFDWNGGIDRSDAVVFFVPQQETCTGSAITIRLGDPQMRLTGKLPEARKGRVVMQLHGTSRPCGCEFLVDYDLTRKPEEPRR